MGRELRPVSRYDEAHHRDLAADQADQIATRPHVHDIDPSRLPDAIRPRRRAADRQRAVVRVDGIDDGIEGRVVACHDGPAVLVQADDGTRRWYPAETAARAGLHCVDCDHDLGMHGMLGCWQPVDEGVCECRQWVERR